MKVLGLTDPRISSSVEGAKAANRESGIRRAVLRMRGFFFEFVPDGAGAEAVDINSARQHRAEEAVAGSAGLPESMPVPTDEEGRVVDMEQYRRIRDAETKVAASYETTPNPGMDLSLLKDLSIG